MTQLRGNSINPYPLGAHIEGGGIRFSFPSCSDNCSLVLFDRSTGKRLKRIALSGEDRIGRLYCRFVPDLDASDVSYYFVEDETIVPDRYARGFAGKHSFGREWKDTDWKAIIPNEIFDWENDTFPRIPYEDCLVYCAHVRGFTKHSSSGVKERGTFLGMVEKIPYLKESGVTTVELQPVYEFAEIPTKAERKAGLILNAYSNSATENDISDADLDRLSPKKCNYWGYKQGYYYTPKDAYAAGDAIQEFKTLVKAFHREGMEVVLQFYFPECMKPVDIIDILRFWVLEYHVDGFHLMGSQLPVNTLATDYLLADTKLWYYYFDTDQIYGKENPNPKNLAVYNDDFLYDMRKYLKGDDSMMNQVLYQMKLVPSKTGRIHYLSNYYGFTLMDMVSYDRKHNEGNGEGNLDGNDHNCSWNCGEEGPSRRKKVEALRRKQLKNAMMFLLLSHSTPLIFMGDEFGNSQKGNNNPYCQDNTITWLNWNDLERNKEIYSFWRQLVAFRKAHPLLHPSRELSVMDSLCCGYPDLSFHGNSAWRPNLENYSRQIGMMYCGKYAKVGSEEDCFLYLGINMYWDNTRLALPKLPKGYKWKYLFGTCGDGYSSNEVLMEGRSFAVYISVLDEEAVKNSKMKKQEYPDRTIF